MGKTISLVQALARIVKTPKEFCAIKITRSGNQSELTLVRPSQTSGFVHIDLKHNEPPTIEDMKYFRRRLRAHGDVKAIWIEQLIIHAVLLKEE